MHQASLRGPGGGVAWQCLQERDGSGDLVAQYTYAPGYIDSPAIQQRDLNGDGDLTDTNEKVWYHSNTLHSVYALTDNSESVVERYRYDAYGGAAVLDADGSDDADGLSDVENPYAFTARRLDLESDLMYYRNRQYSVTLGRFISRDPAGYTDQMNPYSYARNVPTGGIDPAGLYTMKDIKDMARHGRRLASLKVTADLTPSTLHGSRVSIRVPVALGAKWCSQWGYVQIVKQTVYRRETGVFGMSGSISIVESESEDWHIDSDTRTNWPVYQGTIYQARQEPDDQPNHAFVQFIGPLPDKPGWDYDRSSWFYMAQEFETCLVCLDCNNRNGYMNVYGCVHWGHTFMRNRKLERWISVRHGGRIRPQPQRGVPNSLEVDDSCELSPPSATWDKLAREPLCELYERHCS